MLIVLKIISLLLILGISVFIGFLISEKYSARVKELQDLITSMEIFETRIIYTYDTIPSCFNFISENIKSKVNRIFGITSERLKEDKNISAGECFRDTIDGEKIFLSLNKDDIEILKGLSTSLGQTDLEGQNKNIRLVIQGLSSQLDNAVYERNKNYKLSRNIGLVVGLMLSIILI